jgi:hypothetical protein
MPIGYAHIFPVPSPLKTPAAHGPTYQFTFNDGENSYAKILDEDQLVEFLADEIGLQSDVVNGAMGELHTAGKAIIGDLEISQNEAAELGLEEVPTG